VRIAGRHDEGVDLVAGHGAAQRGKAPVAQALEFGIWHGLSGICFQADYDTPQSGVRAHPPLAPGHQRGTSAIVR
jgi:hypothetical protein